MAETITKIDRVKWIDVVQTLCAVGLLVLGVIGYIYTVLPLYSKAVIEEEASKLKLDVEKLATEKKSLESENERNRQQLDEYIKSIRPYVAKQFLGKIRSELEQYQRAPTIFDLSGRNEPIPAPATGMSVIEKNLKNEEFSLLREPDRVALIKMIADFVAGYSDPAAFDSPLDIRVALPVTGPAAALSQQRLREVLESFPADSQRLKSAQQAFEKAVNALQAYLLPANVPPK
jgi:hypothetical protein